MSTSHATGTSDPLPQADRLRQEMRTIRRELGQNVEDLVENAEQLMDWRYYVRRYPWATVGVAALLGYFVVPQRLVTLPTDDHTLARLADRLPSHTQTSEPKNRSSLLGSLISMGVGLALKAATGYVTQQVGKVMAQQPSPQPVEVRHE